MPPLLCVLSTTPKSEGAGRRVLLKAPASLTLRMAGWHPPLATPNVLEKGVKSVAAYYFMASRCTVYKNARCCKIHSRC